MRISIAHSPDSDDAFMFHALAKGHVETPGYEVATELGDIESLNQQALTGFYEITAISFHAYAHLAEVYRLMTCGASFGLKYGPVLVAGSPLTVDQLKGQVVAVPGEWTSANLLLKLAVPGVKTKVVPFMQILNEVAQGNFVAGVVIHEGQLTYQEEGCQKILDLGEWWFEKEDGLPLPLGANAVRRDLGEKVMEDCARMVLKSVQHGIEHRKDALSHAMGFARDMDPKKTDRFVEMYVNDLTLDYGEEGKEAVRRLMIRGFEAGVLPKKIEPDFLCVS